jgi:very-short-patch-repair endonuclease
MVSTAGANVQSKNLLEDILEAAGCRFRDAMRGVDIDAYFTSRSVPLVEGDSKKMVARNTLASLPQRKALQLVLELAQQTKDIPLQDAVFRLQDEGQPDISVITRDRVADLLGTRMHGKGVRPEIIDALFDLSSAADFFGPSKGDDLRINATGPQPTWNARDVFELVGAMVCPTRRFALLVETTLDPRIRDADDQDALAIALSEILRIDGFEVARTGGISGRATYSVRPVRRGVEGRPKNLIFASIGPKPRLGFSDAIDNEIVVLDHAASCLIFDLPIGNELTWLDLVRWWMQRESISDLVEARTALGKRLIASLDDGPEKQFFAAYFRLFSEKLGERLPALVPQVYLHYDPEIVSRLPDKQALFRQRMDFLMLLPGRQRVVIEIDGKHHYADGDRADPQRYARMVEADRALRIRGYEVFRFGGAEFLQTNGTGHDTVDKMIAAFFEQLFAAHRLK